MKLKSALTLVALAVALAAAGGYWLGSRNAPMLSAGGARPKRAAKCCTGTIQWPRYAL
jgi:Cu(I)/Ag(I) efflux system membrane fusion protein